MGNDPTWGPILPLVQRPPGSQHEGPVMILVVWTPCQAVGPVCQKMGRQLLCIVACGWCRVDCICSGNFSREVMSVMGMGSGMGNLG